MSEGKGECDSTSAQPTTTTKEKTKNAKTTRQERRRIESPQGNVSVLRPLE